MLRHNRYGVYYLSAATSLVEVIFSVTLLAIIGINAVAKFFKSSSFQQAVFFQKVLLSLEYIQNLAIGTGCPISVAVVNYNTITFNFRQNCTSGLFNQAILDPKNNNNIFMVVAPADVMISAINLPIYFDPNGLAHNISNNAIVDAIVKLNSQTITITGNTGLISW